LNFYTPACDIEVLLSHQKIKSFLFFILWLLRKPKSQQLFVVLTNFLLPPQNELRGREEEEDKDKDKEEHHGESQEQEESGRSIARSLRVSRVFVRAIEIDWWCRFF
jgi:hypothetical protein